MGILQLLRLNSHPILTLPTVKEVGCPCTLSSATKIKSFLYEVQSVGAGIVCLNCPNEARVNLRVQRRARLPGGGYTD
jgi:hypothetical protein